jgi:hypothetical protein
MEEVILKLFAGFLYMLVFIITDFWYKSVSAIKMADTDAISGSKTPLVSRYLEGA